MTLLKDKNLKSVVISLVLETQTRVQRPPGSVSSQVLSAARFCQQAPSHPAYWIFPSRLGVTERLRVTREDLWTFTLFRNGVWMEKWTFLLLLHCWRETC